jgi:transcriptional regulator with XRE-family HTH domain
LLLASSRLSNEYYLKEVMSVFHANLRRARKNKGLTQRELADLLDLSVDTVRRWEMGQRKPNYDDIIKLSSVLHVTRDSLFDGTPDSDEKAAKEHDWGFFENLRGTNALTDFERIMLSATATKTAIEQAVFLHEKDIEILRALLSQTEEILLEKKLPNQINLDNR